MALFEIKFSKAPGGYMGQDVITETGFSTDVADIAALKQYENKKVEFISVPSAAGLVAKELTGASVNTRSIAY